jgi:hypothetical protein
MRDDVTMNRRLPTWLTYDRLLLAIIFIGVVLRTVAWLARPEFWLDEVAVARNIDERSLWELLAVPLDYGQAAPKGFLLLQWIVTRVAGPSDIAFRFVPFVAGVASLFFFSRIATRLFNRPAAALTLLLFAVGYPFIFYSAENKQYALDLALSLWLIALTLEVRDRDFPVREVRKLAVLGFVVVWFSQYTVITLAALGVSLTLLELRQGVRVAIARLSPIALLWGIGAAAATFVSLKGMYPATDGYMRWFHEANMPPWPLKTKADWLWFWTRTRPMLASFSGFDLDDQRWASLFLWLGVVGVIALAIRRKGSALLVIAPLLLTIIVVSARQYPLAARLWLVPIAILVIGIGETLHRLLELPSRWGRYAGATLAGLVVLLPLIRTVNSPPPFVNDTLVPSLRAVREKWRPGDRMYSPAGNSLTMDYYAPRLGFREGTDYMHASCERKKPGVWNNDYDVLDRLRGEPRVWMIVQASPGKGPTDFQYASYMGVLRDSVTPRIRGTYAGLREGRFNRTRAFLFDFSDSLRLAERSRAAYKPPPRRGRGNLQRQQGDPRWCYGVFMPHVRESKGQIPEAWTSDAMKRRALQPDSSKRRMLDSGSSRKRGR